MIKRLIKNARFRLLLLSRRVAKEKEKDLVKSKTLVAKMVVILIAKIATKIPGLWLVLMAKRLMCIQPSSRIHKNGSIYQNQFATSSLKYVMNTVPSRISNVWCLQLIPIMIIHISRNRIGYHLHMYLHLLRLSLMCLRHLLLRLLILLDKSKCSEKTW